MAPPPRRAFRTRSTRRTVDPDQAATVMDYVRHHGRITRAQAAELWAVEPMEAGTILAMLVENGELLRLGERRGSHYVLPETATAVDRPRRAL